MAYAPRKNSLFGRAFGLKRGPTPRVYATYGIEAKGIFLSTGVDGTFTQVHIEGMTSIEAASTATTAVTARGMTLIPAGASTLFTLAAPPAAGVRKTFFTTSTSTAVRQVKSAVDIVVGFSSSGGGDSGGLVASTAMSVITFNGLGNTVELIGLSTSAWLNSGLRGFTTSANPLSS